ncbi:VapE domain-containing protein [Cyanobium gracile]|uniref:VapE domain-containing protein n=1 Tax=Cyanobium gracile TaxID=59930 RepID=UPI0005BE566F|nr:VapE domain-containing protein [Cyanobium gracile]
MLCSTHQHHITGKPPEHRRSVYRGLGDGWISQELSPEELIDTLTVVGEAIAPGQYQPGRHEIDNRDGDGGDRIWIPIPEETPGATARKSRETFLRSNIYFVDYDNDPEKGDGLSWEAAKTEPLFIESALFAYTTPNHLTQGKGDRFRVVFRLDETITDVDTYISHHREMCSFLSPGFDRSMGPAQCVFGNPGALVHVFDLGNTLTVRRHSGSTNEGQHHSLSGRCGDLDRLRSTLELINSDCDHNTWKQVGSAVRNLTSTDEEAGLDVWLWWCEKDGYPGFNHDHCAGFFRRLSPEPEHGGWGRLESLAGIEYEEPVVEPPLTPEEAIELFGTWPGGFSITSTLALASTSEQIVEADSIGALKIDSTSGKKILCLTSRSTPIDMTYAKTSRIRSNHLLPLFRVLQHEHHLSYDVVKRMVYIDDAPIPELNLKTMYLALSEEHDMVFPREETAEVIMRLALENQFDPFEREMLRIEREAEPIDISSLSSRYLGTTNPLYDTFLEKWLVAFVGRQLHPGLYYRNMPVLKGAQNIGKDAMGQILAGEGNWMSVGSNVSFDNRDFLLAAHSKNLLNFAELEVTTKRVVEGALKDFLSSREDTFAPKYSNQATTTPRRFSYWGSCNRDDFLTDLTGNSRFHVIPVEFDRTKGEMINLERLKSERNGILARAIELFREWQAGRYDLELSKEEMSQSEGMNREYIEESVYLEALSEAFKGRTTIKIGEAYVALDLSARDQANRQITNQVKAALVQLGFNQLKSPVKDRNRRNHKVWVREGHKPDANEVVERGGSHFASLVEESNHPADF